MPDNYDLWEQHQREQDKLLERLPKCADCGEPIQSEQYFDFDGCFYCEDCLENNHRKWVEDFIG